MTVDYQGVSVLIAAIVAAIGSLATIIQNWKASGKVEKNKKEAISARANLETKVDAIGVNVDGHAHEAARKIEALTQAVATQAAGGSIPEQVPGKPGNAPVGTLDGNVTVERAPARRTDSPAGIPVVKDPMHPETDPVVADSVSEGLKKMEDESGN